MCRVIAPLAAMLFREIPSRPSFPPRFSSLPSIVAAIRRRTRIVRHRTLRWFGDPVAIVARKRRYGALDPAVWEYAFRSPAYPYVAMPVRATRRVA